MSNPKSPKKTLIIILTTIFALEFIAMFILGFKQDGFNSDLKYYHDFVSHFPEFFSTERFGFYGVIYFPHFAAIYYPFSYFDVNTLFIIISIANLIALILLLQISFKVDSLLGYVTFAILAATTPSLARWANFGIIATLVNIFCLYSIKKDQEKGRMKPKFLNAFLLALFSYKIASMVIILPILLEFKNFKNFIIYCVYFGISLILLTAPFIYLNPNLLDLSYLIEVYTNGPNVLTPAVMIFRIGFSIPVAYFGCAIIRIIIRKIKAPSQK